MGWKPNDWRIEAENRLVEREPMWDGNTTDWDISSARNTELSENQCGMETYRRRLMGSGGSWVEREPMWDGNKDRMQFFHILLGLSENQCGMETFAVRLVHRLENELSENQCGMETARETQKRVCYQELSENQCGMETSIRPIQSRSILPVEREPMWDGNIDDISVFKTAYAS